MKRNADRLKTKFVDERERVYASAAIWAGKHLDTGALIAANEIGAIGFFLPHNASVLDMYGLLRTKETFSEDGVILVKRERPECIFTRQHFSCKEDVLEIVGNDYVWFSFRTLDIGIRSDLESQLQQHIDEFQVIYDNLDVNREYSWSQREAKSLSDDNPHPEE